MQCVQYRVLYDLSNIWVDRVAKHFILGLNMSIIEVKYRNMEFIIDTNISPNNHHDHHKIPFYISFWRITLILMIPRSVTKKPPN